MYQDRFQGTALSVGQAQSRPLVKFTNSIAYYAACLFLFCCPIIFALLSTCKLSLDHPHQ